MNRSVAVGCVLLSGLALTLAGAYKVAKVSADDQPLAGYSSAETFATL